MAVNRVGLDASAAKPHWKKGPWVSSSQKTPASKTKNGRGTSQKADAKDASAQGKGYGQPAIVPPTDEGNEDSLPKVDPLD